MDFFDAQDRARRKSGLLIFYFGLAVVLMIFTLYVAVVGALGVTASSSQETIDWFQPEVFGLVTMVTLLVIFGGSAYKTAALRSGGENVALSLGGHRIDANTTDPRERRILNVVEEMAIASGVAVPPVYLLKNETGINAFAAGHIPDDAVIGINQGTLDYLTREELQGVVAHEFSHILNGDMGFNLRLIGLLHGILLLAIIGYYMLRFGGMSGRSRGGRKGGGGQIVLIGIAALVVGYIGLFFGRLIKAAVSRQREYLADASAVQFTRNPDGIAGALKKIGGAVEHSYVRSPEAETASHMFFGSAFRRFAHSPFTTHPPLSQRIRRIDPGFDGSFPPVAPLSQLSPEPADAQKKRGVISGRVIPGQEKLPLDPAVLMATVGMPSTEHVGYSHQLLEQLPDVLVRASREIFGARAIVFALLLDDAALRKQQLECIEAAEGEPTRRETEALAKQVAQLDRSTWLPLIELTQSTLRELSADQYTQFRNTVTRLVQADRQINLFEFVLQRVLLKHLDHVFGRSKPPAVRYHSVSAVMRQVVTLLSTLVHLGRVTGDEAQRAFDQAMSVVADDTAMQLLPKESCSLSEIGAAIDKLAECSPPIKKRVLTGATTCVVADGKITSGEAEMLRAVADSLNCPMPPVLGAQSTIGTAV